MLVTYMFSVGVVSSGENEISDMDPMSVYSSVAVHDDEGVINDDWVNDSFSSAKIGDGSGTWLYMPSQKSLILWGRALEFQARFKGIPSWPPKDGHSGSVELRKPIYGSKTLSYRVSKLG